MKLSGAQALLESLKQEGVRYIFGYPGGAVLHIYDAIFQQKDITHILVRHEQGATHAADGYARATGKPGVVLVTSGPGATNAVTGIATAYMDSIPMIIISGQVPKPFIGSDAFQEVDTLGVTRPIVKHNFLVESAEQIPEIVKKAFYLATTGRPGPVVIDIPKDTTDPKKLIEFIYPKNVSLRSYHPNSKPSSNEIKLAIDIILNAKKPVIYSGGGVVLANASQELRTLVSKLNAPITSTLMGLGAFPASDKRFLGMLGMHGTLEANWAMHESDMVLAIGARFDDRVTGEVSQFCPFAKIIHIDIDLSCVGKIIQPTVALVGSAKEILQQILAQLPENIPPERLESWWNSIDLWRAKKCMDYQLSAEVIKPQKVIETLWDITKGEAFITSDVGQHQMWAAQYYHFDKPNRWINSGGLGTMGFGLPAALGVKLAFPQDIVCCVTGEASIIMCIQELSTAKQYQLPIKIINLNNRYMGMVRQWQEFFYNSRYSQSYIDALPDFVALSESFGHVGMQITKPSQLEQGLREALARHDQLVFVDILTDPSENVYPMIEHGKGHHEMLVAPTNRELA
ncbi:MAG: biosynthetic-type acetolactate synthase large subunit [Methylacidiphilales bacterium]|nr:biosynthetic-type acetolactate synthase large subunit [Candidatus Methylacidiphilales bacterium]